MMSYEAGHPGDSAAPGVPFSLPGLHMSQYAQFAHHHAALQQHAQHSQHPQHAQHAQHPQYAQHHQHAQQQHAAAQQRDADYRQHQQHLALMQQLSMDPAVFSILQQQQQHREQHSRDAQHQPQQSHAQRLSHSPPPPSHQSGHVQSHSPQPAPFSSSSSTSSSSSASSSSLPRSVVMTKTGESLAHELNRRRTAAELATKGILYDTRKGQPSVRVQQTVKALRRQMEKDRLSAFIANRPSLDEILRANQNLIEDTMTWTRQVMQGQIPTPRNCHTMTHVAHAPHSSPSSPASSPSLGHLYLLGGYGTGQQQSELLCLSLDDPLGPVWSRPVVAGPVPCERYSHTCSAVGSQLVLFGGLSANSNGTWLNDVHILDTAAAAPSASPSSSSPYYPAGVLSWYQPAIGGCSPPCPRAAHSACVLGTLLYIFAGNDGKQLFNDLYVLDLATLTWSNPQQHGDVPSPRAGHTCNGLPSGHLVVFGGGNANGPTNDLHILDIPTMTWTRPDVYGTPPSPRAGHTACTVFGKELLVFGGGYLNKVFNDLHLFNTETCAWSRPSDTGAVPIPRAGHTSSVIGSRIYTFAGGDAEDVFNDLHLLDTSFFRMMEIVPGLREEEEGESDLKRTVAINHSMSAPTSPSMRLHHRRSGSTEGGGDGALWEEEGGGVLLSKMGEYQRHIGSLVAASVQQLEYRAEESEAEERELLRLLQASRERRLQEYRHAKEGLLQLQLLVDAQLGELREAVVQQAPQRPLSRQQRIRPQQQPQPPLYSAPPVDFSRAPIDGIAEAADGDAQRRAETESPSAQAQTVLSPPPVAAVAASSSPSPSDLSSAAVSSSSSSLAAASLPSSSLPSSSSSSAIRRKSPRKKGAAGKAHHHS